jgi:hypothetical protein
MPPRVREGHKLDRISAAVGTAAQLLRCQDLHAGPLHSSSNQAANNLAPRGVQRPMPVPAERTSRVTLFKSLALATTSHAPTSWALGHGISCRTKLHDSIMPARCLWCSTDKWCSQSHSTLSNYTRPACVSCRGNTSLSVHYANTL